MVTGCTGVYHAWNKVKIDNTWYNVDVTQEAERIDKQNSEVFRYFLISDETLGIEDATPENIR